LVSIFRGILQKPFKHTRRWFPLWKGGKYTHMQRNKLSEYSISRDPLLSPTSPYQLCACFLPSRCRQQ
jgi:hypothetical protein